MKRKFKGSARQRRTRRTAVAGAHLDGDSAVHATHAPQMKREFRQHRNG
ncbi:hypothetical protein [Microbacterium sp.]